MGPAKRSRNHALRSGEGRLKRRLPTSPAHCLFKSGTLVSFAFELTHRPSRTHPMQNHFDDHSMDEHCSYRDCRNNEMLPIGSEPSVDISTQLIKEKIHRIHCMQLERATHGRLTWQGDKIVSTTMRLRERECAVAAIRKQIDKLEAKDQQRESAAMLRESREQCSVPPVVSPRRVTSAKSRSDVCTSGCRGEPH